MRNDDLDNREDRDDYLSVLLPGIRYYNWIYFAESLIRSCTTIGVELIIVGPSCPEAYIKKLRSILGFSNFTFIESKCSPIQAQQLAFKYAAGSLVTWAADDGIFLPNAIDKMLFYNNILKEDGCIGGFYKEGNSSDTLNEDYYKLNYHPCTTLPFVDKDYKCFNIGISKWRLLADIGGWDTDFESCPMAHTDLAIRLQNYIDKPIRYFNECMFECSHTPGTTGDHGPIHFAQTQHDEPLLRKLYSTPESSLIEYRRSESIDREKLKEKIWTRRFSQ